jgi:hypothetical protein
MSSLVSKAQLDLTFMNRSVITCYIEIPVTQDTSCALETRLDIHEQVSYYMLYRDTSSTRYVLCLIEQNCKAHDLSCVIGISIQHVITDLFMNVKSSF